MKSIQLQPLIFPLQQNSQPNHRKQVPHCFSISNLNGTLRPFISSNKALLERQCHRCSSRHRTNVVRGDSLFFLAWKEKTPGEISAFVTISILLFGMYWVSNFLVPDLLMKSWEADKAKDDLNINKDKEDRNENENENENEDDDYDEIYEL